MTSVETNISGQNVRIETGLMAKQANGAVVIKTGDTVLLATACADKTPREGIDFFPLTIDYLEKTYAAGKIPGGFFKREARLSEKETLTCRVIDRSVRPLFPKGFNCETQGIVTVHSFGEENTSDVLGLVGISTALMISDIPFDGPISAVRVGKHEGAFIVNPGLDIAEDLDIEIIVSGTDDAIVMVEGKAKEASEAEMLEALDLAHIEIKKLNALQRELRDKIGKPKREVVPPEIDEALKEKVRAFVSGKLAEASAISDKMERKAALDTLRSEAKDSINTDEEDRSKEISSFFQDIEKELIRNTIINENKRADGRKPDEIRDISSIVGLLPRVHGSALFTRGETQGLVTVTLGTRDDEQKMDTLEGDYYRTFLLHYNFPPYCVGEVKFLRGPGRREIGHGSLAWKALYPVLPSRDDFPYTIRIVSEILESNGSSSMATVCGATLSLMDGGVPIKAPVAGIAMGLVKEGDKAVVLSDILGLEDHMGDMDFKITGTEAGITAFQMDVKIAGIDRTIMERALAQAKQGRLHILSKMNEVLDAPRDNMSPYAPRIYTIIISKDKIRDVIGPGGKVIKGIVEETGVKINVDDDGVVTIASADEESAKKAIKIVESIVEEPEVNKIYTGKVVRVTDFGAFIEIMPGTDGLLHISQISKKRLNKVTDEINEGDEVTVKVIEIDKLGRVRLSRKDLLKDDE